MQAIILAAGMGRRLGELTQNNTKCMVKVNGIPLIDRMLRSLARLTLSRVIIVVGYEGKKLIDHIGSRYEGILNIEYINNPIYEKTNNIYSLALAKEYLVQEDTILLESDLIFEDSLLDLIVSHPHPNLSLVAKYEPWMDGTMVRIDQDNNILNFIPKKAFLYEDIPYYYKTVNIYKFSVEFCRDQYVPFLEAYSKVMGNNEYYEQVLRILTALDRTDLKALPIGDRKWYEIDDIQDLDIAETIFANDDEKLAKMESRQGGYWRFPKLLDFTATVNPYFPPAKMKDEMRANFDTLLTERPSGMRVNSLLTGKYFGINFDYVVVGNGTSELIKSLMKLYPADPVRYRPESPRFSYTADDVKRFITDKGISTLLIGNPDHISGNFIPISELLSLLSWCEERGVTLVVDESFVDFTDDFRHNSLLSNRILEAHPSLVVVKSISAVAGVAGLCLGIVATGDKEKIRNMKQDVAIGKINSFAEYYLQIFSKYDNYYQESCERVIKERELFYEELIRIPYLQVYPSQGNYLPCKVSGNLTSHELTEWLLLEHDILVEECGDNCIRVAVRDRHANAILTHILENIQ